MFPIALLVSLGTFETLVMLGNDCGLFGNRKRARWLLSRFDRITPASGRIVAEVLDPYDTKQPEHFRYHTRNRARGRMAGQARIRVRYLDLATPWFDYLFVSRNELRAMLRGTRWRIERIIDFRGRRTSPYCAKRTPNEPWMNFCRRR